MENNISYLPPDGVFEGSPYWILPNDMKTYSMNKAIEAYKAYHNLK